jgi:glycine reductase
MQESLRVVYYLNQFFGGVGGEEKANTSVEVRNGPVGPARLFQQLLGDRGSVVSTIICGDNFFSEQPEQAREAISRALQESKPHVVVAGPAFDAGRYGLACGAVCQTAQDMDIPAVCAMHPENPGVLTYCRATVIVPTGSSPSDMQEILGRVYPLAVKLAEGVELGLPEVEGYLPRGQRRMIVREEPGYKRAVDMLVRKLNGQSYQSEVPFQPPEAVPPAAPVLDMGRATVALITTGGLIPKGNPDRQTSGNPDRYFTYSVEGLAALTGDDWEAFHGGYYNQISSDNPNYILPLSHLRKLEADGVVGSVFHEIIAMPGVSTPVAKSKRLGVQMAGEFKEAGVNACILVAT